MIDDEDHFSILFPDEIVNFYSPRTIDLSGDIDQTRLLVVVIASHTKPASAARSKRHAKR